MSSNETLTFKFDPSLCTVATCDLAYATVQYVPTLAGNVLYLAIFALLLVTQLFLNIRYRLWGFLAAIIGGLGLEVIGYVARVQMHDNPWLSDPFLMYLICLTIAPCFISACIYLCLSRIISVYGTDLARFKPRTYTIIFITCDIVALVLQAIGGAIADTAKTHADAKQGVNIMIGGLAFQVASLTLFIGLCADFAWQVRKHRNRQISLPAECSKFKMHAFLFALGLATVCIYIRSCFRVAELEGGFDSALANDEVLFMILEGAMVSVACIALTVAHPGMVFGKGWKFAQGRPTSESDSLGDKA